MKAFAHFQEFFERADLLGDAGRLEIVHILEVQLDGQLGIVAGQPVLNFHGQARRSFVQNLVEIVPVDGGELSFLHRPEGLLGLPRKVGHDAHHEGQLDFLHGAAGFHVVGYLHAGPSHPIQFVLQAFSHDFLP